MLDLASEAGKLAASIGAATVSGGAKGVDSAAMSSALDAGGSAIGVLANNLQRACMQRDHRNWILDERLVLLSPYDPSAGFNVGHAMARNKLIYALSDAALVVNADYQKGGTWTGAVEHLNKHRAIPVFVRSGPPKSKALVALRQMGARAWPADLSKEKLRQFLSGQVDDEPVLGSTGYLFEGTPPATEPRVSGTTQVLPLSPPKLPLHVDKGVQHPNSATPEMRLLAHVRTLLLQLLRQPRTLDEISSRLGVIKKQAAAWLNVFIEEGAVVKSGRPARYTVRITDSNSSDKPT
jgi:predicted Rossmann fold nucleotide-binding protein DprA/Smf involved in DNA uptake